MSNMLTTKESTIISDLLSYEENACKKARLYSRSIINPAVSETFKLVAENHQKRFNALFELL